MPLHLNLYHEIQFRELERRRDPLKFGFIGLGIVVALLAGWYGIRMMSVSAAKKQLATLEAEWADVSAKLATAEAKATDSKALITASEAIRSSVENRFLWAPKLERLFGLITPEIRLTLVEGSIADAKTGAFTARIHGEAADPENPQRAAENFRKRLIDLLGERAGSSDATYASRSLDESPDRVKLAGRDAAKVSFVIDASVSGTATPETKGGAK
jgi:hypothetical protein